MDNLRSAGQALVISVAVVLVLLGVWNLAPYVVEAVAAGA
jgi:hypothetical protein